MPDIDLKPTRWSVLIAGAASMLQVGTLSAAAQPVITVHRDPNCGCCLGWVQHLQKAGFPTKVLETKDLDVVKTRLGVPDDPAACHTAEVSGYVIEGHVPALALHRFLPDKPYATVWSEPGDRRETEELTAGLEKRLRFLQEQLVRGVVAGHR
jgi:hypothetical protein